MLNKRQWAALRVGVVAAVLMVLFPPFFNTGGLIGGVRFAFLFYPPAPRAGMDFRPAPAGDVLLLQLCTVACFTVATLIARDNGVKPSCKNVFNACLFAAFALVTGFVAFSLFEPGRGWTSAPFLLCLIPLQFPGGYLLFWLRLGYLAFAMLGLVSLTNRGSKTAVGSIPVAAALGSTFGLLCAVTAAHLPA